MSTALLADRIFDGFRFHDKAAILVSEGRVDAIVPIGDVPSHAQPVMFDDVLLAPGFVDWHVNGGGGSLFNHDRSIEALRTIANSHARYGTTALLPTLITDTSLTMDEAAEAASEALHQNVPGVVGVHFEGPNLSREKCGIHDPALIRPINDRDEDRLLRSDLGVVVVTLAPERNEATRIARLAKNGVRVSLGHSNATYEEGMRAFDLGAGAVTHIYNAMSGLHHREPGLVGAALARRDITVGVIADGYHVHPAALRPFVEPGSLERCSLVTDAMSMVGTDLDEFELNGRVVRRDGDRLTTADGTLAGSNLDMVGAVRFVVRHCEVALGDALRMASTIPSSFLGLNDRGHLRSGARADIVVLSETLHPQGTFILGERVA